MADRSTCKEVARVVWGLGRASVDDVEAQLQGRYTRQQIIKAIGNARSRGLLEIVDRKPGQRHKGIYAKPGVIPRRAQHMLPVPRPVTSVFDIAEPKEIVPEWPLPFPGGRAVSVLGAW